jgi:hypothetical protein
MIDRVSGTGTARMGAAPEPIRSGQVRRRGLRSTRVVS